MLSRETLTEQVGQELGVSDWAEISQQRIDAFADLTEDWQPIHLDPEAARAAGFDGTVVHGFLTLSMLSVMSYQVLPKMDGESASLNYGFDRIRFITPVTSGARIRSRFKLEGAQPRGEGWMLRFGVAVEIEGAAKPALKADWLCLYLF